MEENYNCELNFDRLVEKGTSIEIVIVKWLGTCASIDGKQRIISGKSGEDHNSHILAGTHAINY